jgi:hypothetical protein
MDDNDIIARIEDQLLNRYLDSLDEPEDVDYEDCDQRLGGYDNTPDRWEDVVLYDPDSDFFA